MKHFLEQILIPRSPCYRAIHQQPESLHLGRSPLIAEDNWRERIGRRANRFRVTVPHRAAEAQAMAGSAMRRDPVLT